MGHIAGVDAEQSKRRHPVQPVRVFIATLTYLESSFCVTPAILLLFYITLPGYRVPFTYLNI